MTMGWGMDSEHLINAYDNALYHAGIADQNISSLSSVPPNHQIKALSRNGISYVPLDKTHKKADIDTWQASGLKITKRKEIPGETEGDELYLQLGTSWILNVVISDMRGGSYERITAAIGLARYRFPKGKLGVFAFEDHGFKDPLGCVDNVFEGLKNMIRMRGRSLNARANQPEDVRQEFIIGGKDASSEFLATKEIHHAKDFDMEAYICSMVVPEGYSGVVLVACVMDPFTMIYGR
jgi:pyruvoyl-dependent arginine decarboxylase (PvlArgDC)